MTQFAIAGSRPIWRRFFAVAALGLGLFGPGLPTAMAQATDQADGILNIMWGDPRPGQLNGGMQFELVRPDGTVMPVTIPPEQRNNAIGTFGKRVIVRGLLDRARGAMSVNSIELAETPPTVEKQSLPVTTRRVLNVMVKFLNDTQTPHTSAFYQAMTNPLVPNAGLGIPATINGFFRKTSWAQLRWQGDVVGAGGLNSTVWLTLPKTKAQYANCGWSGVCASLTTLFNDAMTLVVAQGVDVSVYNNISLMLNNDLDCCAWGGGGSFGGKFYGVTWNPPWSQNTGTFVHELGHSIGLPHSGWVYFAYDSNWDQMSRGTAAQNVNCGSYNSANSGAVRTLFCDEPGSGYIAAYKDYLGWIPPANLVTINSVTTQRVVLESNSMALGTRAKMIKICLRDYPCTGSSARYLTVEARIRTTTYEKSLPNEGVLIHDFQRSRSPIGGGNPCFFNTQSGFAVPIDSTPNDYAGSPACNSGGAAYPSWGLHNAQYGVGQSYVSAALGVRVTVVSRVGNTFVVRVRRTK